ncbi:MAG: flagellar motor protein MotB, partial [Campylobacterales bacterium]|nr:flagellar motor protein MotB [Campylobacterales bacterium]
MRFKRSVSSDQNFWVAYADLMAGLLFVFILLIGAIVVKYVFMQGDLRAIKTDLDEQKRILQLSEEELAQKKRDVASVTDQLIAAQAQNVELSFTKAQLEKALRDLHTEADTTEASLAAARALLAEQGRALEEAREGLTLSSQEIETLKLLLLEKEHARKETEEALHVSREKRADLTNMIALKEGELALLAKTLLDKTLAHQKLVEDLDLTKARIQNL